MAPRSLAEYASDRPNEGYKVPACCRLIPPKLLGEIEADHASTAPHSFGFYQDWLKEDHGITVPAMTLRNHFNARHHVRG